MGSTLCRYWHSICNLFFYKFTASAWWAQFHPPRATSWIALLATGMRYRRRSIQRTRMHIRTDTCGITAWNYFCNLALKDRNPLFMQPLILRYMARLCINIPQALCLVHTRFVSDYLYLPVQMFFLSLCWLHRKKWGDSAGAGNLKIARVYWENCPPTSTVLWMPCGEQPILAETGTDSNRTLKSYSVTRKQLASNCQVSLPERRQLQVEGSQCNFSRFLN